MHYNGPFTKKELLRATQTVPPGFFSVPAEVLAPTLLGCVLFHGSTAGMLVETEAYLGKDDLAAHSAHGLTDRTRVIFGPAGRAYIYLIYGMHECLNVVADSVGTPGCVLVRALAPLCGIETMRQRRKWEGALHGLANGPGKLTRAMDISRRHYGVRLERGELCIRRWRAIPQFEIGITPRIGIRECADWPLRFTWAGHPCVSR